MGIVQDRLHGIRKFTLRDTFPDWIDWMWVQNPHSNVHMNNDIAGIPQALQKSRRPVKAIHARFNGKEGNLCETS